MCTTADKKFNTTGAGTKSLRVLNTRKPVILGLFTGGKTAPLLQALSAPMTFDDPSEPLHVHLALTTKPGELLAQWTSASSAPQAVRWASVPNARSVTLATSTVSTYTINDMCGPPANKEGWFEPGFLHRAVMTRLAPRQPVYYRVGSDTVGWSAEFALRAPTPAGFPGATVRLLLTADTGATEPDGWRSQGSIPQHTDTQSQSGLTLQRLAEALPADAVLHIGASHAVSKVVFFNSWDRQVT